jgi:hypothetical protein
MSLVWRLLIFGFVAGVLAKVGGAQTPAAAAAGDASGSALSGSLLGRDPRLVAWAAHDAVESGDGSQVPRLLALASQWRALSGRGDEGASAAGLSAEQMDERDAMAAVVDALIQMKTAVPADTLRALAPDFGSDVAVLLSRMPAEQAGALIFEFYRQSAEHEYGLQYVSAALLALHPVPGFAADLIANTKVRATVLVVLPGTVGGAGGGSSLCGGDGSQSPRSDWPMIGQYALSAKRGDGDVQLVGGIDPVYARRFEAEHYRGPSSDVRLGPEERVRLIAEMLEISPDDIPWKTSVDTTIEFQSLGQFEEALADFIDQQREMHRATVAALEALKLLTAAEADESLPELEVSLNDLRGEDAEPLSNAIKLSSRVKLVAQSF